MATTRKGKEVKAFFAPNYERNEDGEVIFPRDTKLHNLILPALDPTEHVAKCNMHMIQALVEYVSEVGESILDPFTGRGTILIAVSMGRKVICIEIEQPFVVMLENNLKMMRNTIPDIDEMVTLIPGDTYKILPIPNLANHAIFSPPWGNVLRKKSVDEIAKEWGYESATKYSAHPDNIANLNDFIYFQKMEKVYRKIYDSLTPGGTMTIIIKDRMEAGVRVKLGMRAKRDCERVGWEPVAWNRWRAIGGAFAAVNRAKGQETVEEEDLITLRKPV